MTTDVDVHLPRDPAADSPAWRAIADLPLKIESIDGELITAPVGPQLNRKVTVLHLAGGGGGGDGDGHVGRGEDVTYLTDLQDQLLDHFRTLPLAGTHTIASFSALLDELTLIVTGIDGWEQFVDYTRWAFEAAALDLALRQAGISFAQAVGQPAQPMRWVLSMGLGAPVDCAKVHRWRAAIPGVEFKLDASDLWTANVCRELADTDAIAVVDFKGHYGAAADWMTNQPTPQTYADVAAHLPGVLLEDAKLDVDFRAALGDAGLARATWDAPIHSIADIVAFCERAPTSAINIKPSRFGTLRELLGAIEHCRTHDLPMYAGGQTELSIGRTQAQTLAACWYADAGNDLAPVVFHAASAGDEGLPHGPVVVPDQPGFGFDA